MLAAAFGSAEAVQAAARRGADVKAASNAGVTALHLSRRRRQQGAPAARPRRRREREVEAWQDAAPRRRLRHGTADVVRLLLAKGADVNAADSSGVTPLIAAASVDNAAVARLLLAARRQRQRRRAGRRPVSHAR